MTWMMICEEAVAMLKITTNRRIREVENRIQAAKTSVQILEQVMKHVLKTQA